MKNNTIYDFSVNALSGKELDLSSYKGKVVLVVNTASKCGFTPQYAGLESLYQDYKGVGFEIIGFPCNQFGNQEPGNAESIKNGCLLNYGVSFQICSKVDVKGSKAHPLFIWLTKKLPGMFGKSVKWNFTKFLIDRNGIPYKRYSPLAKPESIKLDIEKLLLEIRSDHV